MSQRDRRSFRVALVADRYINPGPGRLDAMPILLELEWGVIQLPSERYSAETASRLLEQVAEQAEEFHRRGYDLVVIGRRTGLARALRLAGIPALDGIVPRTAGELRAFLRRRKPAKARADRRIPGSPA